LAMFKWRSHSMDVSVSEQAVLPGMSFSPSGFLLVSPSQRSLFL